MAMINAAIVGDNYFTVTLDGETYTLTNTHPNYERAREALKNRDADELSKLVDIPRAVSEFSEGQVEVVNGDVLFKGEVIHNSLTRRMLQMMREGFDITALARFLENLMKNPSYRAVQELYNFMDACQLPITDDGHFLAYKRVRNNFTDIHSGTFDNSPGCVCEMPRNTVDEDKNRTCSTGLHFCSISYLPEFGGISPQTDDQVVIVKINPCDVVAIPADYNNAKGRTCRYEVVDVWDEWTKFVNNHEEFFKSSVVTNYTPPSYTKPKSEMTESEKRQTRAWKNGWEEGNERGYEDCVDGVTASPEEYLDDYELKTGGLYGQGYIEGYYAGWDDAVEENAMLEEGMEDFESETDTSGDVFNRAVPRHTDGGFSGANIVDGVDDDDDDDAERDADFDKTKTRAWQNGITEGMEQAKLDRSLGKSFALTNALNLTGVYGEAYTLAYSRSYNNPSWNWFEGDR